jgi:hypothetical protein
MATYDQIQEYVSARHRFVPKTCWIAHVKEMVGLPVTRAWNRRCDKREQPCPPGKVEPIKDAFRHFGLIK